MASYRGKRVLKRRRLTPLAAAALLMVLFMSVGGTLAWLTAHTSAITNTFTVATPGVKIEEGFDKQTKSNVQVKNTGEVEAYIRVALVPTWEDENGNAVAEPASLDDLSITWGNSGKWLKGTDGYWYYKEPVAPGGRTAVLLEKATVTTENGYQMNLQVMADSIQADPTRAVTAMWGKDKGGAVTGVDGTMLLIQQP